MEKVNLLFKIQTIKSIDIYMINTFHNLLLLIFTDQPEIRGISKIQTYIITYLLLLTD